MTMKKTLISVMLVLLLAFSIGLAACGGSPETKYTVTFLNGTAVHETQSVKTGETASKPAADPAPGDGQTFSGWYAELEADGSGKGEAFDFTSKITKDLTLYAAFTKDAAGGDEKVAVLFNGIFEIHNVESEFTPMAYGMKYYDYIDFEVAVLDVANVEFTVPEAYAYQDITQIDGVYFEQDEYHTWYSYSDEQEEIHFYAEVYDDFISLNVYDYDWENGIDVFYYIYGDITVIEYYDNTDGGDDYVIITNGGVTEIYTIIDWEKLGDDVILTADFVDTYVKNGVVWMDAYDLKLRADCLRASYQGQDDWVDFIIKDGEPVGIPGYSEEYYDISYGYSQLFAVDVELKYAQLIEKGAIAKYRTIYEEQLQLGTYGEIDFTETKQDVAIEYNMYIHDAEWDDLGIYHIEIYIDEGDDGNSDYFYHFAIDTAADNSLVAIEFTVIDDGNWNSYFADVETYELYKRSWALTKITEEYVLPSEQFALYKKLGLDIWFETIGTVKDGYLRTSYQGQDDWVDTFIKDGEPVGVSGYSEGYRDTSYGYYQLVAVDVELKYAQLIEEDATQKYRTIYEEQRPLGDYDWHTVTETKQDVTIEYYIYIGDVAWEDLGIYYIEIYIDGGDGNDDYFYHFVIDTAADNSLVAIEFTVIDDGNWNRYFADVETYELYKYSDELTKITEEYVLPSEQFALYKKLNLELRFETVETVNDEYLPVWILDGISEERMYIRAGEEYTLPSPYGEDPDTRYEYNKLTRADVGDIDLTFKYTDILSLDELYENYSDNFNAGWRPIGDTDYFINADDGVIYYLSCEKIIDDIKYRCDLWYDSTGAVTDCMYIYNDFEGYLLLDGDGNVTDACTWEYVTAVGNTFSIDSIDSIELHKLFGIDLIIIIYDR